MSGLGTPERINAYFYGETIEEAGAFIENPKAMKILEHLLAEFGKSTKRGDVRPEWDQLIEMIKLALDNISPLNFNAACWRFFQLGMLTQELTRETSNEMINLYQNTLSHRKSKLPLIIHNLKADYVKKLAQATARKKWKADKSKELRIIDMASIVWAELHDSLDKDFVGALPDKQEGIKPWIRSVAPEYAKVGGRPKKKP